MVLRPPARIGTGSPEPGGRATVRVLGVRVDCVDMEDAVLRISSWLDHPDPHLVATVNPEFVMRARWDHRFAEVLDSASLCLPDGAGVLWAMRRQGADVAERVTGVDLMERLAAVCAGKGRSIFLLGGAPGVAERAAAGLRDRHPGLEISGTFSGAHDDPAGVALIQAAHPAVVAVAYGAPKQELWMAEHGRELGVPVAIGVGGSLDFLAGEARRAPVWLQRAGLEWLHRLVRQPWRLWRMRVLPVFALLVLARGDASRTPAGTN